MDALGCAYALLIIMLGTNDTKERFGVNAACMGITLPSPDRLCKTRSVSPQLRSHRIFQKRYKKAVKLINFTAFTMDFRGSNP